MPRLITFIDFIFGCHHSNLSRVFTLHRQSYKVCCDCGAKFKYSLESMSIEHRVAEPSPRCFKPACFEPTMDRSVI